MAGVKKDEAKTAEGWGGKRDRAGRPPIPPEDRLRKTSVTLSPKDIAYAESIGGGSLSAGLRELVRRARQS